MVFKSEVDVERIAEEFNKMSDEFSELESRITDLEMKVENDTGVDSDDLGKYKVKDTKSHISASFKPERDDVIDAIAMYLREDDDTNMNQNTEDKEEYTTGIFGEEEDEGINMSKSESADIDMNDGLSEMDQGCLNGLFKAHACIAEDIGQRRMLSDDIREGHINGEEEALICVETAIVENFIEGDQ